MSSTPRFELPSESLAHTWVVSGDLVVSLTQEGAIPPEVWNRFVADVASKSIRSVMGLSIGSVSINSVQRKAISDAVKGKNLAAILQSPVVRGILTAMSWFGIAVKAYSWQNLHEAITFVGADVKTTEAAIRRLLESSGAPSLADLVK
jgi:hypothetical protein